MSRTLNVPELPIPIHAVVTPTLAMATSLAYLLLILQLLQFLLSSPPLYLLLPLLPLHIFLPLLYLGPVTAKMLRKRTEVVALAS